MNLVERLTLENQILQRDGMAQFQVFESPSGAYYLWGEHRTNAGNPYTLWVPLPSGFPHERPPLYIHAPNPLWGYAYGKTINSYGLSHGMHTLNNGPNSEVQICHWRSDRWHSAITLNKVMLKAMLWLEAYEQHLSTGRDIDEFVKTMAP
jgi:hypothetical protein